MNKKEIKKRNNIFILTVDEKYFIIEKKILYQSAFFKYLFNLRKGIGYLGKPIYLQVVFSNEFDIIINYLKEYTDKEDDWIATGYNNDVLDYFETQFDKDFIKRIKSKYSNDKNKYKKLLNSISYLGIPVLYKKINLLYHFVFN